MVNVPIPLWKRLAAPVARHTCGRVNAANVCAVSLAIGADSGRLKQSATPIFFLHPLFAVGVVVRGVSGVDFGLVLFVSFCGLLAQLVFVGVIPPLASIPMFGVSLRVALANQHVVPTLLLLSLFCVFDLRPL